MNRLVVAIAVVLASACNVDIDEPWELDHDRIIAVRAEPPGILAGQTSTIDMLLGYETLPVEIKRPDVVTVVAPQSLANTVSFDGTSWIVTAPSDDVLAAVRTELELDADAPIPLQIGAAVAWPTPVMSPEGNGFAATKTVWLGREGLNPSITMTIAGFEPPPPEETVVFPKAKGSASPPKTWLEVAADAERDNINWLTSCGVMHDFDLPRAYVTVEAEDRTEGQLALVLRDELGGVSWRIWNCRAE